MTTVKTQSAASKSVEAFSGAVFISTLGVGNYSHLNYGAYEGEPEGLTTGSRFIQLARLRSLRVRGIRVSAAYVLVTDGEYGSRAKNWDEGGQDNGVPGLCKELEAEDLSATAVTIPTGTTQEEFWEIFKLVSDLVPENSDVYVDLTHGFRTLPVLVLMALEFVSKVKNARVIELTYGAERVVDGQKVGETWNLEPFLVLRDWVDAVSSFVTYGDTRPLAAVALKPTKELGKVLRERTPPELGSLNRALTNFGEALSKCHSPSLPKAAANLKKLVRLVRESDLDHGPLRPLTSLLDRVQAKLVCFPESINCERDKLQAQCAAAEWCLHHNRAMQGLTFLREGIVSALRVRLGVTNDDADTYLGLLTLYGSNQLSHEQARPIQHLLDDPPFAPAIWTALYRQLASLTNLRNKLNHAYNGHEDLRPVSQAELEAAAFGSIEANKVGFLPVFQQMIDSLPTTDSSPQSA